MNSEEFIKWLGTELRYLFQISIESSLIDASRGLVRKAIENLESITTLEQKKVVDEITSSHQSGMIGDYQLPFDDRDKIDTIEAILGTIKGIVDD